MIPELNRIYQGKEIYIRYRLKHFGHPDHEYWKKRNRNDRGQFS